MYSGCSIFFQRLRARRERKARKFLLVQNKRIKKALGSWKGWIVVRDTVEMARWRAKGYWEVRQSLRALKMLKDEKRRAVSFANTRIHQKYRSWFAIDECIIIPIHSIAQE